MPIVAPPPAGSRIEVRETAEGLELRSPPFSQSWVRRCVDALAMALLACWAAAGAAGFICACANFLWTVLVGPGEKDDWIFAAFILGFTAPWFGLAILALGAIQEASRSRPGRIVLWNDWIEFDLGGMRPFVELPPSLIGAPHPDAPEAVVEGWWPRCEVDSIAIDDRISEAKIVVRRGRKRAVFGWKLDATDRAWLHDLLRGWQEERLKLRDWPKLEPDLASPQPPNSDAPSATPSVPSLAIPAPPGGRIEAIRTADGLDIQLPRMQGFAQQRPQAMLSIWLGLWALGAILATYAIFDLLLGGARPGGTPAAVFLTVWLALWTCGGAAALRSLKLVNANRPERIALDADSLTFDLGASDFPMQHTGPTPLAGRMRLGKPVARGIWPRSKVDSIEFVFTQFGLLIAVEGGREIVYLGWRLGGAEREWLRRVLLKWKDDGLGR